MRNSVLVDDSYIIQKFLKKI